MLLDSLAVMVALAGVGDRLPEIQLTSLSVTSVTVGRERNLIAPSHRDLVESARNSERRPYQWDLNIMGD